MDFESIFRKADNIEGCFIEAGFGKGKTADIILNLMKEEKIKKRSGYLLDTFVNMHIGHAMDRRHLLPGYDISVIKGDVKDTISQVNLKIATAHIDLDNKPAIKEALVQINNALAKNGIIIFSFINDELRNYTLDLINELGLNYKIKTEQSTLYIVNLSPPVNFNIKVEKGRAEVEDIRRKVKQSSKLTATSVHKGKNKNEQVLQPKGLLIDKKVIR